MLKDERWRGLGEEAKASLATRDYAARSLTERLQTTGLEAAQLLGDARRELEAAWIPGVEIFARAVYPQRFRGVFGELARQNEGPLCALNFWPQQWSAARMDAGTAKGFHIHPPYIPDDEKNPADYLRRSHGPSGIGERNYTREQWDVMFIIQGRTEMILRDRRAGFSALTMRFFIDGDNHRGASNVGVIIPPGVAHALRVEGSEDVIMVYGTTTSFRPDFEGRIASEIETAELPAGWQKFLDS